MSTVPAATGPAVTLGSGGRGWRMARWVVLALVLATMATVALVGRRHTSYERLLDGLAAGRVHEVQVVGAMGGDRGLIHDEQGVAVVELRWRDGPLAYLTEVTQATSQEELNRQAQMGRSPEPHLVGRVDTPLRQAAPGVHLTWSAGSGGTTVTMGPWQVQGRWTWLPMASVVAVLLLVAGGPEPRWATRAGWVWLVVTSLWALALMAYLVATARPAVPRRWRLNGWWAFVLSCLRTSMLRRM